MHPKILKPELNVMPKMGNWIISAVYEIQTSSCSDSDSHVYSAADFLTKDD